MEVARFFGQAARPNLILITVDALRPDHLGCYGYAKDTSPNLDAFAQGAWQYENAVATGPNTPHSFPGIMASRMPFESTGFGIHDVPLTMAEMLRSLGYHTQGFMSGNAYLTPYFGYDRGFDEFVDFLEYRPIDPALLPSGQAPKRTGSRVPSGVAACHAFLQGLIEGIKSVGLLRRIAERTGWAWRPILEPLWHRTLARIKQSRTTAFVPPVRQWIAKNQSVPFFLWLHPMSVHDPYAPLEEWQRAINGRALPIRRVLQLQHMVYEVGHDRRRHPVTEEDVRDSIALYDAEIRGVDSFLGEVFNGLRQRGWWDSSIIIVTSDHGELLYEHGRFCHPSLHYDELLRVPLLIRMPGRTDGCRVARQVGLIDLMPTLADLLGHELPPGVCLGRSFAETLETEQDEYCDPQLYVSQSFYGAHDAVFTIDWRHLWRYGRRISFRNRCLKLVMDCTTGACHAFNLLEDPGENRNLANDRPDLVQIARALGRMVVRQGERERLRRTLADQLPGLTTDSAARP